MNIYIVTEDLGDGDIGLRYFSSHEKAEKYMTKNADWCYHESNPHVITVYTDDNFKFNDAEEEVI